MAMACEVAATAATGWPVYRIFSRAMQPRAIQRMSFGPEGSGLSRGSIGRSSPVITATTPCSASALEVSIFLISAWACGLRSTLPQTMPGML